MNSGALLQLVFALAPMVIKYAPQVIALLEQMIEDASKLDVGATNVPVLQGLKTAKSAVQTAYATAQLKAMLAGGNALPGVEPNSQMHKL